MKNLLLLLGLAFVASNSYGQQEPCLHGFLIQQQLQSDPSYAVKMAQLEQETNDYLQQNPTRATIG